ncbi:Acyltransferase family protein, partial [Aphelenchoides avenae]
MQIVMNAYFAVDTFFFQSGLLLAYVWFKKYRQSPRSVCSASGWFFFYFHRIVRLSPAYFFIIAFYTWVFRTWLHGMPVYLGEDVTGVRNCEKFWWTNFLYMNNI